jgi:hypothetical protein
VVIQLVGVVAPYQTYAQIYNRLTGVTLIQPERLEQSSGQFGRDPLRWIPDLSPLLVQGAVVASSASEALGGPAITLRYGPYEGVHRSVDLRHNAAVLGIHVADFWWALPVTAAEPRPSGWIAVAMLVLGLACAGALVRLWRRPVAAAAPSIDRSPEGAVRAVARRQLARPDRLLVARQLRALDAELIDGEEPHVVAAVAVDGHLGAAMATSDALLIATRGTVERIPIDALRDVTAEQARRGMRVRLRYEDRARDLTMIWPPRRAHELVEAVTQAPLVAERA